MMTASEARPAECGPNDPNFEEFLADPMVRLLMRRDHIPVDDARRLFRDAATRIRTGRHQRLAASVRESSASLMA